MSKRAALFLILLVPFLSSIAKADEMDYQTFLEQASWGVIKEVSIDAESSVIRGTRKDGSKFVTPFPAQRDRMMVDLLINGVGIVQNTPSENESSSLLFLASWLILLYLLIWLAPMLLIALSKKVSGREKVAWILGCFFISWVIWILFLLLAPLKPIDNQSK